MPPDFVSQFPTGAEIAYSAIPVIKDLQEPLRTEVRIAFASSMRVVWLTMIGISGLGLLSSLMMKELPMTKDVDENFALKEKQAKNEDAETAT